MISTIVFKTGEKTEILERQAESECERNKEGEEGIISGSLAH